MKNVAGRTDIEDALRRLNELVPEGRAAVDGAQIVFNWPFIQSLNAYRPDGAGSAGERVQPRVQQIAKTIDKLHRSWFHPNTLAAVT
jgi:hypothetical protein